MTNQISLRKHTSEGTFSDMADRIDTILFLKDIWSFICKWSGVSAN